MNNPGKNNSNTDDHATDFGVQEFTQAIPSREYLASIAERRAAAKSFVKTLGISWLKIRGETPKSK